MPILERRLIRRRQRTRRRRKKVDGGTHCSIVNDGTSPYTPARVACEHLRNAICICVTPRYADPPPFKRRLSASKRRVPFVVEKGFSCTR